MEGYAECMLLLFHSYRSNKCLEPFQPWSSFPFVMKLRELNAIDHLLASRGEMKLIFNNNINIYFKVVAVQIQVVERVP